MNTGMERVGNRHIYRCKACGLIVDENDRDFILEVQRRHQAACPGPKPAAS